MEMFPGAAGIKTTGTYFPKTLGQNLNERRKMTKYTDITLLCNGVKFPAHKSVICSSSEYFEVMLEGTFSESRQDEIDLTESIPDPKVLESILTFMYTGQLEVRAANFQELLDAASLLLLTDAVELVSEYILHTLVIGNCLEVFYLAFKYSLTKLSLVCMSLMKSRMHDFFIHRSRLLSVPPEILVHLFDQNVFVCTNTTDVKNMMVDYIENLSSQKGREDVKERIGRLGEIAKGYGIEDAFGDNSQQQEMEQIETKQPAGQPVPNPDYEEVLFLKYTDINCETRESIEDEKKDLCLIAFLLRSSKWVKLNSVSLPGELYDGLNQGQEQFIGFIDQSMVFQNDTNMLYNELVKIPLTGEKFIYVTNPCPYCRLKRLDNFCPHTFFTAWNGLFCIFPVGMCVENVDGEDDALITGYSIKKYSGEGNEWDVVCYLDIPTGFYKEIPNAEEFFYQKEIPHILPFMQFQALDVGSTVYLVMINTDFSDSWHTETNKYFLSIFEISQSEYGCLSSRVEFHRQVNKKDWKFYSKAVVSSFVSKESRKLRFHKLIHKRLVERVVEVDIDKRRVKSFSLGDTSEVPNNGLPFQLTPPDFQLHSKFDKLRSYNKESAYVPSLQDGNLYKVHNLHQYISQFKSYDAVQKEWRYLPGPPNENKINSFCMKTVPAEVMSLLQDLPASAFEDGYSDTTYGPYHKYKLSLCPGKESDMSSSNDSA